MLSVVDPGMAFLTRHHDPSDDYLTRARGLVELALHRRRADGMLGTRDPDHEIDRLLRPKAPVVLVENHTYDPTTTLGQLVATLGLEPTEADLLAVLLASETDPAIAQLIAYLGATSAPTVDVLFEIVYRPRTLVQNQAAMLLHRDLAPAAVLRRLKFLLVDGTDARPFLLQTVRLAGRTTGWLLGQREIDPEIAARLVTPEPATPALPPDVVAAAVRAVRDGRQVLALRGPRGAGRELVMRAVACSLQRPLLVVDGRRAQNVTAVVREAVLQNAIVFVRDAEELLATPEAHARIVEAIAATTQTVALAILPASRLPLVATEVVVPVPARDERLGLWRAALPGPSSMTKREWRELSGLYNLGIGGIAEACEQARAAAAGGVVTRGQIAAAVRRMFASDLDAVATRVEVTQSWDDLVLPADVMESIQGITDRIAFQAEVFGDWGFARKLGKGLGLTMLFSGGPGTGKSMVAGLIARELGLDLYVIDLARITSKWIGETEKNLARAFDAAEAGHVMLLFDEADTVLGKRTANIQSSNDRHANLETNFILARLEQFQGIAVFTTNLASAIDPAISRRMSASIQFPFPDRDARVELWRRMIPREAPVAETLDLRAVAGRFELSGGFIRNIVLRAAFLAAREGGAIDTHHLERAARSEYGDRGSLSVGGRLA